MVRGSEEEDGLNALLPSLPVERDRGEEYGSVD